MKIEAIFKLFDLKITIINLNIQEKDYKFFKQFFFLKYFINSQKIQDVSNFLMSNRVCARFLRVVFLLASARLTFSQIFVFFSRICA